MSVWRFENVVAVRHGMGAFGQKRAKICLKRRFFEKLQF